MKVLRIASLCLLYMKQLPFKKDPYMAALLHTDIDQWLVDALYCTDCMCTCEKHPTGFFGVGDAVAAQVPGAITRFQCAQTCSGLSVPLVALLKRALASTLLGGAVEMLSHYGVATGPGLATRMEF